MSAVFRNPQADRLPTQPDKVPDAPPASPYRETEAPDWGVLDEDREAPEMADSRLAEAPDAGEGRLGNLEHEFTHGRSQS